MLNILLSSLNELPSIVVYACSVSAKAAFQGIQDVVLAADDAFFAPLLYAHHLLSFIPTRAHINALVSASGRTVLDRVRYLVRNSPYASNAVDYFASQIVGAGITPAWKTRKEELSAAWLAWTDEADAEGLTDLYGLQRRAAREVFIAGEVFFRVRMRRPEDGMIVPFQLQMLPQHD
jgi:capsid protein